MAQRSDGDQLNLGFLQVTLTPSGYVGGLLVTNRQGRPLEFQCTTPVQPNRTQEILYGPTLKPFIYSELLGKTLFERLAVKPGVVIVQETSLLDLRPHVPCPVACILQPDDTVALADELRRQLGRQTVVVHAEHSDDLDALNRVSQLIPNDADLVEPLERVGEALSETVRAGAVA
ncbi:MAG: hypothetical protein H6824_18955 [Planctomycetaceae bacterium]|nr:hypothetical protein [Planctomycetaceae bacterium]